MKTYRIICTTDPYHGARHYGFKRGTNNYYKVCESGLTLEEARKWMLNSICQDADTYYPNWGIACINARRTSDNCIFSAGTDREGMRYYSYDVFNYRMEEEQEANEQ